jgi:hypothetical protein
MFSVVAVANAHPYKDTEKRLKIVPVSVAVALEFYVRSVFVLL